MRNIRWIPQLISQSTLRLCLAILMVGTVLSLPTLIAEKADGDAGTPVKVVVTVKARHGQDVPSIGRDDVVVREGPNRDHVTGWVPLQGEHAGMDLFILLDDGSDTYLGVKLADIRNFINSQPATTRIAVGYMRNGTVQTVQAFTTEHAAAAKALRLPMGTPGNNPYFSLTDLMKQLPSGAERREILLVSDGIDPGEGLLDPYLDSTIEQAQRNGIGIYAIYASGVGSYDSRRINLGQNNLSRLTAETGGEAYFQGFHTPIAFAPFLADISTQLNHQYMLTFVAEPEKRSSFRHISLETEVPNAVLITADQVDVPAVPVPR